MTSPCVVTTVPVGPRLKPLPGTLQLIVPLSFVFGKGVAWRGSLEATNLWMVARFLLLWRATKGISASEGARDGPHQLPMLGIHRNQGAPGFSGCDRRVQ
jgi:hypothetical protein